MFLLMRWQTTFVGGLPNRPKLIELSDNSPSRCPLRQLGIAKQVDAIQLEESSRGTLAQCLGMQI